MHTQKNSADHSSYPRLLADIGGTNARFALENSPGHIDTIKTLHVADHASFTDAIQAYLEQSGSPRVHHAAAAIANPILGDTIKMTNHDWSFSIEESRRQLQFDTLLMINDFTALSLALPHFKSYELKQIGGGEAQPNSTIGLIGPGTGLGVGGLVCANENHLPLSSEGGHVSFSPGSPREANILSYCWKQFDHVSAERLMSGPGIELIHHALLDIDGQPPSSLKTQDIVTQGLAQEDGYCRETLDIFCGMLGNAAANLAVTLGAFGGIYIGGGVVLHLGDYFQRSPFRTRFEHKGRFSDYTKKIPTFVITSDYPAFPGVSAALRQRLGN